MRSILLKEPNLKEEEADHPSKKKKDDVMQKRKEYDMAKDYKQMKQDLDALIRANDRLSNTLVSLSGNSRLQKKIRPIL